MTNYETKDFVAYEYMSINVSSEKEPLYMDCYENFGWIFINGSGLVDKEDYYINNSHVNGRKLVNLKFKRDRKIPNKVQIISLQKKCEIALKELNRLEKQPRSKATISAITIAMLGTVFMALSVFSITAINPIYILCVVCGVIGIVGWLLPYFVYKKEKLKKEQENIPLIEEQYNTIYNCCEQAKKLIN